MQSRDIGQARLAAQQISATRFDDPAALVAHMGAMQAQDHAHALWAIGLRVKGGTATSVQGAIAARGVVRTWMLRGTLHFVAGADLRWMLALVGARNVAGAASRHRQLGLDQKVFDSCRKLFEKALAGTTLTRGALFALLGEQGIETAGQRGIHILWRLAQDGVLCFSAHEGKQPAFALLDDWLPQSAPALTRDEALARLCERYFAGHGPATVADFAWWAGLTLGDARRALAACEGLQPAEIEGQQFWMPEGLAPSGRAGVHLLPGFDEYLLGYKERGAVLDEAYAGRVCPGGNGVFKPMIVAGGRIVGTWQRGADGLAPEPFESLTQAQAGAMERAAKRYCAFWGKQA